MCSVMVACSVEASMLHESASLRWKLPLSLCVCSYTYVQYIRVMEGKGSQPELVTRVAETL